MDPLAAIGRGINRLTARLLLSPARFSRLLLAVERSAAHAELCARVYDRNLCQFNLMTAPQLDAVLEALALNAGDEVLDVGCGVGAVTEHLQAVSGARVTGVDFAAAAVERARARTGDRHDRPRFEVVDINTVGFPHDHYDAVVAIDSLYFARDLDATVAALVRSLRPGGRMALLYSQISRAPGAEILQPAQTWLGRALRACGAPFGVRDFTASEARFWRALYRELVALRPAFRAEGSMGLFRARYHESRKMLRLAEAGRLARYLYRVTDAGASRA